MINTRWLQKRREYWTRLQSLLDQSDAKGLKSLGRDQLREIALLYRQTAADLSTLRQDPSGGQYTSFVHQLLRRAHNVVYATDHPKRGAFLRFFTHEYPEVFLRNVNLVAAAFVIFALAALIGTIATINDSAFSAQLLGPEMMRTIEQREMWTHSIVSIKPAASSMIMTNNLSVSFMAFAGGIAAGIITVILMFFNGLLMGVIATACWLNGMSLKLWSFVAPHGALELPAIFIAAGAGLRLAQGLLFPGYLPRRMSLVNAGADAVRLLLGVVPILVIAGMIEGFISPSDLAVPLKFVIGVVLLFLLATYLYSPRFRGHP